MATIHDYLQWRGDLSFEQSAFNNVDNLILSRLSYYPFDDIVPKSFDENPVSIWRAAEIILSRVVDDKVDGRILGEHDQELLHDLLDSPRFSELKMIGYINTLDPIKEKQFSATTFLLDKKTVFISFRGTDSTIVGWKEDFNMSFQDTVDSQIDALHYLESVIKSFGRKKYLVGGHSKGGNLAVYASSFCKKKYQDRIVTVYNNDGPGFMKKAIEQEGFQRLIPRIKTFVPQSSVVGQLLEHEEDFSVIYSDELLILRQHHIFSWQVQRDDFVRRDKLSKSSLFVDETMKKWVSEISPDQREKVIDGVFQVVQSVNAKDVQELLSGKNLLKMTKNFRELDDDTKELVKTAVSLLRQSLTSSFSDMIHESLDEKSENKMKEIN